MSIVENNVLACKALNRVCSALGVKLVSGAEIVQIGSAAGYDSLFIDMEHSILTIRDVGQLCITAIEARITPFVRVPHQCGNGFIQKVLDGGAMGVVIPHIHTIEDARRAIRVSKYPPVGNRSITGALPYFRQRAVPQKEIIEQTNASGSTVTIMIETRDALANVDELAAEPGCDVLLVGAQDLSTELGTNGIWDHPEFLDALEKVGAASAKHGKIFGIAGLYHRPDILDIVVNKYGARWVVGQNDHGLLLNAARENGALIRSIQRLDGFNNVCVDSPTA